MLWNRILICELASFIYAFISLCTYPSVFNHSRLFCLLIVFYRNFNSIIQFLDEQRRKIGVE